MFVILLISKILTNGTNEYGYWTGKLYIVQGEPYPVCDEKITAKTKRYTTKRRAENAATRILMKFGYVDSCCIEELPERACDND